MGRETEAQSGGGTCPRSSLVEGEEHQVGILRLGLNSSSATRSWAALGETFLLSGFDQSWSQAGARAPRGTGWAGDREGKDTNCHRPGAHALGGSLKHFYLYSENVDVL